MDQTIRMDWKALRNTEAKPFKNNEKKKILERARARREEIDSRLYHPGFNRVGAGIRCVVCEKENHGLGHICPEAREGKGCSFGEPRCKTDQKFLRRVVNILDGNNKQRRPHAKAR